MPISFYLTFPCPFSFSLPNPFGICLSDISYNLTLSLSDSLSLHLSFSAIFPQSPPKFSSISVCLSLGLCNYFFFLFDQMNIHCIILGDFMHNSEEFIKTPSLATSTCPSPHMKWRDFSLPQLNFLIGQKPQISPQVLAHIKVVLRELFLICHII